MEMNEASGRESLQDPLISEEANELRSAVMALYEARGFRVAHVLRYPHPTEFVWYLDESGLRQGWLLKQFELSQADKVDAYHAAATFATLSNRLGADNVVSLSPTLELAQQHGFDSLQDLVLYMVREPSAE